MRLLIVEDSADLADALANGFRKHSFVVDVCDNGEDGFHFATSSPYTVIILDRMLPKVDGLLLCQALRSHGSNVPILLLTARDSVQDRVAGLDAGADDYLVKPFAFDELLARTRALSRRSTSPRANVLRAQDVELDLATGQVKRAGLPVLVSAKEFAILAALLRHPGRLLTHDQLMDEAWNASCESSTEVVRAHIKNLRRKLSLDGRRGIIETVHGQGYRVVS
ncbi:MAG: response regulator transcription factor [Polyangiaceae bacterium]